MLLNFNFKNFRSFYNTAELSLIATRKRDHIDKLIKIDGFDRNILPLIVIYGGNASGKTSTLLAQMMLKEIVVKTNISRTTSPLINNLPICSFIHETTKYETPTEFDITFADSINGKDYDIIRYKCVVKNKAEIPLTSKVFSEELYVNDTYIFKRTEKMVDFNTNKNVSKYYYLNNNDFEDTKKLLEIQKKKFEETMSYEKVFTAWYSNLNSILVDRITKWFTDKYITIYNFDESSTSFMVEIDGEEKENKSNKIVVKDEIFDTLKKCMFTGPQEITLESNREDIGEKNRKLELKSIFYIKEQNENKIGVAIDSVFAESKGTLKMYNFLAPFISALLNGTTLVVDELDASIHPEVIIGIVKIFKNPEINKKGAQLIFNTHNPIYLNKNIFRRDELYFVEKNEETFESELYSLVDFDSSVIRSDENYMKNYINGKYGAVPFVDFEQSIRMLLKQKEE